MTQNMTSEPIPVSEIYGDNPLITNLPPILSMSDVIKHLRGKQKFDPSQRYLSGEERIHLIAKLPRDFFQPLTKHLELEQKIAIMLREGYISRNFTDGNRQLHLQYDFQRLSNNPEVSYEYAKPQSTATSLAILGCSGSGKTTTVNKILNYYPQVIRHNQHGLTQLVYLKIDCPHDSSLKNLCFNFFKAVDVALGNTNFVNRFHRGKLNVNAMIQEMKIIAHNYSVGLLIIDEIQHLTRKKSDVAELILNFIVTLVNVASIPIIMIGTPKASTILEADLRSARRSAGFGSLLWEPMRNEAPSPDPDQPDEMIPSEWYAFTDKLWRYQWVQQPVELTEELRNTWYYYTQGILDLVVKLFCLVQIHAITIGSETITVELFKKVYEEQFKPVHEILNALRSGNPTRIAKYSDLIIPQVQMEEYIEKQTLKTTLKEEKDYQKFGPHYSSLTGMLISMGHEPSKVEPLVKATLMKYRNENIQKLMQYLLEELSSPDHSESDLQKQKSKTTQSAPNSRTSRKILKQEEWLKTDPDDLRHFYAQAQQKGMDVHALLESSSSYLFNPTSPILH